MAVLVFLPACGRYTVLPSPDSAPFYPLTYRIDRFVNLLAESPSLSLDDLLELLLPPLFRHDFSYWLSVVATAFAYHRKREFVQLAPTGAVAEALGYVPKYGEPPEAAGPDHVIYQTPLSFVNDVFVNTVGYSLCDVATTTVSNLVETPPAGTVMFEYDVRKDSGQRHFWDEMKKMWSIVEPGDVVAFMTDHPSPKKKKPGLCHAVLYVGDPLKDGHTMRLHVTGDGADAGNALGRLNGALNKSLFDGMLHGRNGNYLKERTKIVLLRPLALPAVKWPVTEAARARLGAPDVR